MYKFVDSNESEYDFEGYAYQGKFGVEKVTTLSEQVTIQDSEGGEADIAYVDIPKLVLALKGAYHFKFGTEI